MPIVFCNYLFVLHYRNNRLGITKPINKIMRLLLLTLFINSISIGQSFQVNTIKEAIANKEVVTSITLSNISDLTIDITEMPKLEELILSESNVISLPDFISRVNTLKRINLNNNPGININQVSEVLSGLKLISLSFKGCKLPFIPFQLTKITSLIQLNVSNNYITKLPSEISKLNNLEYLNLAMNYLDSIHAPINSLPNLKVLDLSFNKNVIFDHLIISSIDFPALEEVKVLGVKHFPSSLNKRKDNLEKIDLSMTDFEDIKQLTTDSFKVKHVIANNCKKLNYDFLCKSLERSGVRKLEIADEKMANLPRGIHRMKSLEELIVSKSLINYVPSLNNHKSLKRITINSNELSTIYSSVKSLPNLEYLNIKRTVVNTQEVIKLIKKFPHAEIVYNPQKIGTPVRFPDFLKDLNFKAPFKNLVQSFEEFTFNSKSTNQIKLASGTTISVSPNSFQFKDNILYDGEVVFEIKEIKSSLEIFASGLPMVYDSTALFGFESGGMYVMKAKTKNGIALSLRDNKFVKVKTELPDDNGGFQTYELNDQNKWVNNGKQVNYIQPGGNLFGGGGSSLYQNISIIEPRIEHDGISLEIWKTDITKGYNLIIKGGSGVDFDKTGRSSDKSVSLNHFKVLSTQTWIIIDSHREEKIKRMKNSKNIIKSDKVSYSKNPKYIFSNVIEVSFTPQISKDNFLLRIVTETEVLELEIIQDLSNVGPKASKRKITKQWKRFKKEEMKRIELNKSIRVAWENEMSNYQKAVQKTYSDSVFKTDRPIEYAEKQKANFNYERYQNQVFKGVANSGEFTFTNLLACNVDRLNSELLAKGNQTFFTPTNSIGENIKLESVSVLSTSLAKVMTYTGNMVFLFDLSKTIIIGKTISGDLAYMNTSTVEGIKKGKDGKAIFEFKVIDPNETSLKELQNLTLQ